MRQDPGGDMIGGVSVYHDRESWVEVVEDECRGEGVCP